MGRIHLVRHGQASLLRDDYDCLSPLGERQSQVVGEWLGVRLESPPMVVSGALKRQVQTASACITGAGWHATVATVDDGFDEYSHNDVFAQAYPELAEPAALGAYLRASEHPRREFHALFERAFVGWLRGDTSGQRGLTWAQFRQRCMAALNRVAAGCGPGQAAMVVTSGGPIAAICQELLGLPDERVLALHTPLFNGSITQLLTRPAQIALSTFNSVAHLELHPDRQSLITYR